ncbi:hypothetical protein GQ600_26061 [Phytophthora cactorum]|nr:hypothetical protein GQ600_26061 [Phytophthora cactorum]
MSVVVVLGSVLDLVSPIDERPLSLFQGSVSEWSDMRTCPAVLVYVAIIVYDTINCTQLRATWTNASLPTHTLVDDLMKCASSRLLDAPI